MAISRTAALAAAGIVGSGVVGGLTYAAVSAPATAAPAASRPVVQTAQAAGPRPAAGMRLARRTLLNRLEHGQLTVQVPTGDRTIDLQKGTVTSVLPSSISVR